MVSFENGPAAGKVLTLRRAPLFLRVTQAATGVFDALDLVHDQPAAAEAIFVYRRLGAAGSVHLDGRNAKTGRRFGEWFAIADYRFSVRQPEDGVLRDTTLWQAWCADERAREQQEEAKA